jgi:nucleoside-diphosphate-sugar epimerase
MGWEHVVPQFARRLKAVAAKHPAGKLPFELQGNGQQTRSFCHVDDLVAGVLVMRDKGEHLGIYHVGTTEEITIAELATQVATHAGREIELIHRPAPEGGTERRCPDITKLEKLGYRPKVSLAQGLPLTVDWYWAHENLAPPQN